MIEQWSASETVKILSNELLLVHDPKQTKIAKAVKAASVMKAIMSAKKLISEDGPSYETEYIEVETVLSV